MGIMMKTQASNVTNLAIISSYSCYLDITLFIYRCELNMFNKAQE